MKVETGRENHVYSEVIKHEKIRKVAEVLGPYDVLAEADVTDEKELEDVIIRYLRNIEGVRETVTLIAVREQVK